MTFPAASKCMACHIAVAKEKPAIQKLAAMAKSGQPIPWVRVYHLADWVWFSHRTHLEAKASCDTCHGPVAERDVLAREVKPDMNFCMNCHRKNNATLDCNGCHEGH